ncbi:MAG: EamA family transporter, partial [Candidatus Bathyarchaeia archaeon]
LFLLSKEDATVLSGSSLIVPLLALLIGWRVLGESVGAQSLLGATLTLCGVYLVNAVNRRDLRKNQFLFSQTRRC